MISPKKVQKTCFLAVNRLPYSENVSEKKLTNCIEMKAWKFELSLNYQHSFCFTLNLRVVHNIFPLKYD